MRPREFFRFNKETYQTVVTQRTTEDLQASHDQKRQKYQFHKKWQPCGFLVTIVTHAATLWLLVYSMRYTDVAFAKIMIIRNELERRTMVECQDLVRSAGPDGGIELSNEDVQLLLRAGNLERIAEVDESPPPYETHKEEGTTVKIRRNSGHATTGNTRDTWV